jgi:transcriptional regulator with GAF, ATPase, and Fis domain
MKIIGSGDISRSGLQDMVTGLDFDLEKHDNILVDTVKNCSYYHVLDAWENPRVDDDMKRIIAAGEFVTIPLVAKSEVIGVVFADNAYSGTPIVDEAIEELSMFAASAALAIENSRMLEVLENQVKELEEAYKKLENTHAMLIRHEKLAAVGEVSTRLAMRYGIRWRPSAASPSQSPASTRTGSVRSATPTSSSRKYAV